MCDLSERKPEGSLEAKVMNDIIKPEYVKLYIHYRVLSVLCSTAAYLIWLPQRSYRWYFAALVPIGMITACAIGTFLYKKIIFEEKNRLWLFLTLMLEQIAYGIFIYMSGGLSSPYLWCFLGYIFLVAVTDRYRFLLALSVIWMVLCITVGDSILNPNQGFSQSDINTIIGIVLVFAGFYTLQQYTVQLEERRRESELLNRRLQEEKEATEQALQQITDLYDTVNIFTIANQNQSMDELTKLLTRSIAPNGCMLLKFNMGEQQEIDDISSDGLEEHIVQKILKKLNEMEPRQMTKTLMAEGRLFEVRIIGKGIFLSGLLVIASDEDEDNQAEAGSQMLHFYQNIIETVFKDMDIQKSLEDGIIKEEQHRIASEIHDTVIQKLFGISCSLNVLENTVDKLSKNELKDWLKSIEKSSGLVMKELREAIYGMRFENGDEKSFEHKLKLYLQEAERLNSVSICLNSTGDFSLLSAAQKTVVYRIICEAVNNAIRHGNASHINAEIKMNGNGIAIQVKDNGSGFEPVLASAEGTGMKNMHRMASLMKGTCSICSKKEKGTEVDVFIPW